MGKTIYFTVTNDLSYDQRMHRICTTLANAGYEVTLVGRKLKNSPALETTPFHRRRISCFFNKGKWFYREYNLRLFFFLLFRKMDAVCAIDLDTILPCWYISRLKKIHRIYDAHELFTELKEVVTRPQIRAAWLRIEKKAVPHFSHGYTVSDGIAEEFKKRYGVNYATIRNLPVLRTIEEVKRTEKFILYQGAVNEARGFEWLIPAMQAVDGRLVVCGDGNFMPQLKALVNEHGLGKKVEIRGQVRPDELWEIACRARAGVAIAENLGLNQWLALPNKFFDYIQAGLPQVTMDFPEYRKINDRYEVALLIPEPSPERISGALNKLLNDDVLYEKLRSQCLLARKELNWQQEEQKLTSFYASLFPRE